jgi:hypothetical protein
VKPATHSGARPTGRDRRKAEVTVDARWLVLGGIGLAALVASWVVGHEGARGQATLKGAVVYSGRPVSEAQVWLDGSRQCRTVTDNVGVFELPYVPAGPWTLFVEAGGFRVGYPLQLPPEGVVSLGSLPLYDPEGPPLFGDVAAQLLPAEGLRVYN